MLTLDSPSHPLYGIDDLDWSQWHTAYGDATDTEWNLKRLVNSKSRKTKENALWNIRVSVYHQDGLYSANPITLPFLIRILKSGFLQNSLELKLLSLITDLGQLDLFQGRWIVTGIPEFNKALSPYLDIDGLLIFHQAYEQMDELRDYCLEKFKTHKSSAFRCQALHLLMYLQKDRESIIAALQNQYPLEKNLNVRLSIVWAIAFMGMHLSSKQQQQIHQWIKLHKPHFYRGVTAHMFTVAELYLGDFTPEIQNHVVQMIKDNAEYPKLLDQCGCDYADLVHIALLLVNKKGSSSAEYYQFFKVMLENHFNLHLMQQETKKYQETKQYKDWRSDLIFETLIQLSFNEPIGLHQYWYDHSWQEQQALRLKLNVQQVDTLTFLCLHPVWKNHHTNHLLKKFRLPESYEEIALFLGWLPEFDHWRQKDQFLNKPQMEQFPELKPIIEYRGLIPFIENFFSLSESQLENFTSLLNWQNLSANSSINFTSELIRQHQNTWHWGILSNNKAVKWHADLLSEFSDKVYWSAISERGNLEWTPSFIKQFIDFWDWEDLSLNENLPWSAELIAEFSKHWDWRDLSGNTALPWNIELLNEFSNYWDWEELSENESLPWNEEFFNQFSKHWWHYKDALARNSKIPWTEDRLKKFDDFHWEHYLSKNNGLPWSESFIEKHQDKINWYDFSKITSFNWTEDFIEQHKENLGFDRLAENPSLPWSIDLINRYKDKWNWYVLSKNPGLPWSTKLLEQFEDYWDWGTIPYNQHIPWAEESIAILKRHTRKISRIKSQNFPWTLELVNDPTFAYVFDSDDDSLYSKVIAPLLNQDNVTKLLSNHQNFLENQKELRRKHFDKYGPEIAADHLLRKILSVN